MSFVCLQDDKEGKGGVKHDVDVCSVQLPLPLQIKHESHGTRKKLETRHSSFKELPSQPMTRESHASRPVSSARGAVSYSMVQPRPLGVQEPRHGPYNVTDLKFGRSHSWNTAVDHGYQPFHMPANHGWVETVPAPPPPERAGKLVTGTSGKGSRAVCSHAQDRGKFAMEYKQRHLAVAHMTRTSRAAHGLQHGKVHAGMHGLHIHDRVPEVYGSQTGEDVRESSWTDRRRAASGP